MGSELDLRRVGVLATGNRLSSGARLASIVETRVLGCLFLNRRRVIRNHRKSIVCAVQPSAYLSCRAKLALILEEILTIADEFPLQDPSEQKMITLINKLRSKFRKAQTLLGVPQPNKTELSAKEAVSF